MASARDAGWRSRALRVALAALLLALCAVPSALAASPAAGKMPVALVMVDDLGCPYCARWDDEVGVGYAKTPEGRFAPLQRVRRGDRSLAAFKPVTHTPTFIVVHQGAEVGRIIGYPGAHFFWPMLGDILARIGYDARQAGG